MKTTLYHGRGQTTRMKVNPPNAMGTAGIEIDQGGHRLTIESSDAAWLEELEGAVREARLRLEARPSLKAVS